eukprot:9295214-Pyramimonas_sp.AAC.1
MKTALRRKQRVGRTERVPNDKTHMKHKVGNCCSNPAQERTAGKGACCFSAALAAERRALFIW